PVLAAISEKKAAEHDGQIEQLKQRISQRRAWLQTAMDLPEQVPTQIGDPAPKLQVGKWIQGEPVEAFESNHVYLVVFWATWYPPSVAAMPQVNELQQRFRNKGLVVSGQNSQEC